MHWIDILWGFERFYTLKSYHAEIILFSVSTIETNGRISVLPRRYVLYSIWGNITVPSCQKYSMKTNYFVCPEYYEGFLTHPCLSSPWDRDRIMSPDIEAAHTLVREQKASLPQIHTANILLEGCNNVILWWPHGVCVRVCVLFCFQVWRTAQPYMDIYRKKLLTWICADATD